MTSNLGPFDATDEEQLLTDVQARLNYKSTTTYEQARRAMEIRRKNPWMPMGTALSLGKAGASDQAVEAMAKIAGKRIYATDQKQDPIQQEAQKQNIFSRWVGYATHNNPVYAGLKAGSRWLAAGAQMLPEMIQNTAADIVDDNNDVNGWFAATTLGQMFQHGNLQGSGFFPGKGVVEEQKKHAREYRKGALLDGDKTFTVGRAAAQLFFAPNSKAYNVASGIVDAAIMAGADPVGKALKAGGIAAKAPGLIPAADDVAVLSTKLAEYGEAGLSKAEQVTFDASKWGKWINTNKRAQRLVDNLAGENDVVRVVDMFDGRISLDTAAKLAGETDATKIKGILGEAASRFSDTGPGRALLPEYISDVNGTGFLSSRLPLYRLMNQGIFAEMPKNFVNVAGDERSNMDAFRNVVNYLKKMGLEVSGPNADPKARKIINQAVKAYSQTGTRPDVKELDKLFVGKKGIVTEALKRSGAADDVIEFVVGGVRRKLGELRTYNIDQLGNLDDGGYAQALLESDLIDEKTAEWLAQKYLKGDINNLADLRFNSPGALVEMLNRVQVLPDARAIARLTKVPFYRQAAAKGLGTSASIGEMPWALRFLESAQNDVWRPLALMTGGYILRNMADAQIRIAASGRAGILNHPIQYLQYVMGSRAVGTINKGGRFLMEEDLADISPVLDDMGNFVLGMKKGAHTAAIDPVNEMERMVRTGGYSIADRGGDLEGWTTGMVDSLRLVWNDPLQSLYARISHLDDDVQRQVVKSFFETDQGAKELQSIREQLRYGVDLSDHRTGKTVTVPFKNVDSASVDDILDLYWEKLTKAKANAVVKNNESLRVAAGWNAVPLGESEVVTAGDELFNTIERLDMGAGGRISKMVETGFGTEEVQYAVLEKNIRMVKNNKVVSYKVVPIGDLNALDPDLGSKRLRSFIQSLGPEEAPKMTKVAVRVGKDGKGKALKEGWDRATRMFFNDLYGGKVVKYERSPLFRQSYYSHVAENVDLMSPEEAQKLLDNVYQYSAEAFADRPAAAAWSTDKKAARYVGNDDVWNTIKQKAARANGTGTIEQLQDYASTRALYEVEETFYSAANKNNLEDAMRVIAPFAPAWKEVLGKYVRLMVEDPSRVRKAQRTFTGAINWDTDQDGLGFFYKDPTTNQYMFQFPMSTAIYKLFAGGQATAALEAPVKRLSIGLSVLPALGPVAQIAASNIIPDVPAADDLKNFLLPYGETTISSLTPGWIKKAYEAFSGDPGQTATMYGQEYGNVVRALAASGQYNMDDINDREQLFDDAKRHARVMVLMRAASQFLGPTAGTSEYQIPTKQGDVYSSFLISEYQRLKEENYDTSVSEFLKLYGEDAYPYLASKTRATRGGLEATRDFSNWERTNKGLVSTHKGVAGYLAPAGDKFSYAAFNRQIESGARERLTGQEMIDAAELRVGSAKYRAARLKAGPYPTEAQRSILRNYREELNKRYPGFPVVAQFNPGEFKDTVRKLELLVQDPRTKDNETADSIRQYLYFRSKALETANQMGYVDLSAKALSNVRIWLMEKAQNLIDVNPNFARVYDRELSIEVED